MSMATSAPETSSMTAAASVSVRSPAGFPGKVRLRSTSNMGTLRSMELMPSGLMAG